LARVFTQKDPNTSTAGGDYIDGKTKDLSGKIDFFYQLAIDPLTWFTGGLSSAARAGTRAVKTMEKFPGYVDGKAIGVKKVFEDEKNGVRKLWDDQLGPKVSDLIDAKKTGDRVAQKRIIDDIKLNHPAYNNDSAIKMLEDNINISGVTILVCTFNGKARLEPVLAHLSCQKAIFPIEVIIVDNASTDGTREFCDAWWKEQGNSSIEYRSIVQPKPGKAFAQDLGTNEAKYKYVLICDDDNWLAPDYCQIAFDIMESDPRIGVLGGNAKAVFPKSVIVPEWYANASSMYAVGKQGNTDAGLEDLTSGRSYVYGAGCIIRKRIPLQLKLHGIELVMSCRIGNQLLSGGDNELCFLANAMGYKIFWSADLHLEHFMPESRLTLDYVCRMREGAAETWNTIYYYFNSIKGRNYDKKWLIQDLFVSIKKTVIWKLKVLIGRKKDFEFYWLVFEKNEKKRLFWVFLITY
jgi:glycosyltransferase involved in cell wall biosynthesis